MQMFTLSAVGTIDQLLVDFLNQLIPPFGNFLLSILSLVMAAFLSGLIGYEREYHGHSAGLRTHILVALGSSLIMLLSIYGFGDFNLDRDPARLAAQVITGVGFIGAGTIIQNGFDIRGLTTATTLWLAMAIGLASGAGQFILATAGALVGLFTLIMLRKFEAYVNRKAPKLFILVKDNQPVLKSLHESSREVRVGIRHIDSQITTFQGNKVLRVTVTYSQMNHATALTLIEDVKLRINPINITTSFHVE
jgi:putative Mg2+ transporter-C (MgtC) family protein